VRFHLANIICPLTFDKQQE